MYFYHQELDTRQVPHVGIGPSPILRSFCGVNRSNDARYGCVAHSCLRILAVDDPVGTRANVTCLLVERRLCVVLRFPIFDQKINMFYLRRL